MNAHLIRPLILGVFAFPLSVAGQVNADRTGGWTAAVDVQPVLEQTGTPVRELPGQGAAVKTVYSDAGHNFYSNVPINELSAKAYRRFHHRFRQVPTGEYWFKYDEGYKVSFTANQRPSFAYFNSGGTFLYSLRYYDATELSSDLREFVKRRFPDYAIDVVTEVNDGMKTFYTVQLQNPDHVKVVTIADGRMEVVRELTNGGAQTGPASAVR